MSKLNLGYPLISKITEGSRTLKILWDDGHCSIYHYIWLRDNSPQSRDAHGQRLHHIHDIAEKIHPWSVVVSEDGGLEILWAQAEHRSYFSPGWLRAHCYSRPSQTVQTVKECGISSKKTELWSGRVMTKQILNAEIHEVGNNPVHCRDWMETFKRFGVGILKGVGNNSGDLEHAIEKLGNIRETHWGRTFELNRNLNRPYSDHAPKATMANEMPYRNPMPELQVFHCLSSGGHGAAFTLVDGYLVGGLLRRKHPGMFSLLSSFPVPFFWADSQHCFFMGRMMIDTNFRGETTGLHMNHQCCGPFHVPWEIMEAYYKAYRTFSEMLSDPSYHFNVILEPGEILVMENARVLHDTNNLPSQNLSRLQVCFASWQEGWG